MLITGVEIQTNIIVNTKMGGLAVVILNYNGIEFLKKYLGILIKNSGNYEVIVADNGSTDSSLDWLKKITRE